MCVMNIIFINRSLDKKLSFKNVFLRPAVPSLIMGIAAYGVFYLCCMFIAPDGRLAMALDMCIAIAVAVIVYAVAVIKLRAITAEDMALIPKGDKIARLLHMS